MSDLKPLPYYKWFWQDFRASRSVQKMTYVERGLYRELLDECWSEGSIPSDLESLADICGCPVEVMASAWQVLSKCFVAKGRRMVNFRLDSERTEKDSQRVNRQESGRLGGLAKLNKINPIVADAKQVLSTCHIEEESRVEEKREKNKKPVREVTISHLKEESKESFQQVWKNWPKRMDDSYSKGSRGKAEKCFQAIVDSGTATPDELLKCAEIYRTHPNVKKGYVQMVATFFSLDAGTWVECLELYRKHTEAQNAPEN